MLAGVDDFKGFIAEAKEKSFQDSELLQSMEDVIVEAEKCAAVAQQLVSCKVRTRCQQSGDSRYQAKLSLDELQAFCDQMLSLQCVVKETKLVQVAYQPTNGPHSCSWLLIVCFLSFKDLLQKVLDFQTKVRSALSDDRPRTQPLQELLDEGMSLDVDVTEMTSLRELVKQAQWLDDVEAMLEGLFLQPVSVMSYKLL